MHQATNYPVPVVSLDELKLMVLLFDKVNFVIPTLDQKMRALDQLANEILEKEINFGEAIEIILRKIMVEGELVDQSDSIWHFEVPGPLYDDGYLQRHSKSLVHDSIVEFQESADSGDAIARAMVGIFSYIVSRGVYLSSSELLSGWSSFLEQFVSTRHQMGQHFVTTHPRVDDELRRVLVKSGVSSEQTFFSNLYDRLDLKIDYLEDMPIDEILEIRQKTSSSRATFHSLVGDRVRELVAEYDHRDAEQIELSLESYRHEITDGYLEFKQQIETNKIFRRFLLKKEAVKGAATFGISVTSGLPISLAVAASTVVPLIDMFAELRSLTTAETRKTDDGIHTFLIKLENGSF